MKPFFPYYGSKWNTARYYPEPRGRVIEPFAGSAGYSLYYSLENVILYDLDAVVCGVWDFLIKASPADVLALPNLPNVGDCVDDINVCQEAKWLIGFWLNRGSAVPKKSRTAYSARTDKAQLNWGQRAKERIASEMHNLSTWQVFNASYETAPVKTGTWFIDPPYEIKGNSYRMPFRHFDQLADWVETLRGQTIVCENKGATWLPFEPLGSFKSTKARSEEVMYYVAR